MPGIKRPLGKTEHSDSVLQRHLISFVLWRTALKRPLQRVADLILRALAHSISFDFVPYCFVNVHKLDFLFRTLLKFSLRFGKRACIH